MRKVEFRCADGRVLRGTQFSNTDELKKAAHEYNTEHGFGVTRLTDEDDKTIWVATRPFDGVNYSLEPDLSFDDIWSTYDECEGDVDKFLFYHN